MTEANETAKTEEELAEMIAETESGARNPTGTFPKKILFLVPLIWTMFQLWYASPLPFLFNFFVINDTEARAIHLAFAVFLAFTAFPTFKKISDKVYPGAGLGPWPARCFLFGLSLYLLCGARGSSRLANPDRLDCFGCRYDPVA